MRLVRLLSLLVPSSKIYQNKGNCGVIFSITAQSFTQVNSFAMNFDALHFPSF